MRGERAAPPPSAELWQETLGEWTFTVTEVATWAASGAEGARGISIGAVSADNGTAQACEMSIDNLKELSEAAGLEDLELQLAQLTLLDSKRAFSRFPASAASQEEIWSGLVRKLTVECLDDVWSVMAPRGTFL